MRSAKERHCTAATVPHQRDKSKTSSAGRQQSRSARSPQDSKKAVQQREPDLHHHRTLRETTTRTQNRLCTKTFSPKKKRARSGEHHVHDTTTARLTTNGAQCQNRTKHLTIQPSEKPRKTHGQTSKNKQIHNSTWLPLITRLKQENLDPNWPDDNNKDTKAHSPLQSTPS